jgi:hypothetical protein
VGALVSRLSESVFPKSFCGHFVVAFDHRAYTRLDCRRCDGLSEMRMASVDPTDFNPMGTEIIHVTGFVSGSMPLLKKRMLMKFMRYLKAFVIIVTLAVIAKAALYYDVLNLRPLPALAEGAKTDEEFTTRVLQRFPLGSSAAILRATLEEDSRWGPIIKDNINKNGGEFVVITRPIGLMTKESTNSEGRLTYLRANILRDSGVP